MSAYMLQANWAVLQTNLLRVGQAAVEKPSYADVQALLSRATQVQSASTECLATSPAQDRDRQNSSDAPQDHDPGLASYGATAVHTEPAAADLTVKVGSRSAGQQYIQY